MKRITVVLIALLISQLSFGQFQKKDLVAGGTIKLEKQLDYSSLFNIEGLLGYYLTDRLSVGTRLWYNDDALDGQKTLLFIDPYVRYNIINKKYQLHVGTGGLFRFGNSDWRGSKVFKPKLSVGVGHMISDNFIIDLVYDTYYYSKYVKQLNVDHSLGIFFIARF